MDKVIDLSKTVYAICTEYPEVKDLMKELGFDDIINPGMLSTVGRFMTLPKGVAMKKISLDKLRGEFKSKGYQIKE